VIVLFAAALVVLSGLVGMSIDVGQLVYTKADVQKIADASALAGSQDLPSTANATTSANDYATQNGAATTSISFGSSNTTITVQATRHVDFTFLKVLGFDGRDVSATATAKATHTTITGYAWNAVAPFVIWGGAQQKPVNADKGCDYHTCVGKSYTFWSNQWLKDSGTPVAPDWTAANSNNFKGDVNHGAGAPSNEIGDFFSDGGNGNAVTPKAGDILVIPVVDKASDGSNSRQFHIVAWVMIKVDAGCDKGGNKPCTGTVLNPATTVPPAGYDGNGSVQPPNGLTYTSTDDRLIS
jgi:Flp pilus assembly protein TadG